jgi:hypothetical protein
LPRKRCTHCRREFASRNALFRHLGSSPGHRDLRRQHVWTRRTLNEACRTRGIAVLHPRTDADVRDDDLTVPSTFLRPQFREDLCGRMDCAVKPAVPMWPGSSFRVFAYDMCIGGLRLDSIAVGPAHLEILLDLSYNESDFALRGLICAARDEYVRRMMRDA